MTAILDIHTHTARPYSIVNSSPRLFTPQEGYFYSIGIHPWDASRCDTGDIALLRKQAPMPQVLAIGETGLDRLSDTPIEMQTRLFKIHCQLAEEVRKPMIVHMVKAADQVLAMRRDVSPTVPWIIHGFRGKPEQVRQLLRHGFYLSFGCRYNEDTLRIVPMDRLFIETDETGTTIDAVLNAAARTLAIREEDLRTTLHANVQSIFFG